jgi:signal transduction histidine kinase
MSSRLAGGGAKRLPILLWPLGVAAELAALYFLIGGGADVTAVDLINRSVGGSFIACGLIAWQLRPANRTGRLMTAVGFLFLVEPLLTEVDSSIAYTLGQVAANWWAIPFVALVLGFPDGRLKSVVDRLLVAGFAFETVVLQLVWVFFLDFPEGNSNVLSISGDAGVADVIDKFQLWMVVALALALAVVVFERWRRAAPPLRRLLLPAVAGAGTFVVLAIQVLHQLTVDESARATQTALAVALVSVPVAFLLGLLRAHVARGGMANLVVELRRARGSRRLDDALGKALGDPSLVVAYWVPRFGSYVDADGRPLGLPSDGSGRATTLVEHEGRPLAALIHDPFLTYQPDLLEAVCAAADLALEQESLQAELKARLDELAGSRARIVEAGDAERRRLERNLHDGAQQNLLSLVLALRLAEVRIHDDPEAAERMVAEARAGISRSLEELRELARGIHPAVLEHGLGVALESLAARFEIPVSISLELTERLPEPVELAAYFVASEALANVTRYAHASKVTMGVSRHDGQALIEVVDDGVGGADDARGSGLRGLADRVEALGGRLQIESPVGGGTRITAEMPCAS